VTDEFTDAIPRLQPGTRHGGGLSPDSDLPERWNSVLVAASDALEAPPDARRRDSEKD